MTTPGSRRICVLGMGNVLTGDDALGPKVLEILAAEWELGDEVIVEDVGTPGIDLTMYLVDMDALVVVDAVNATGAPGELRVYDRDVLVRGAIPVKTSPHEPTLKEALLRLDFMEAGPRDVTLVGAIPKTLETNAPMSAEMRAALSGVVDRVIAELVRLGARPRRLDTPRALASWWERPTLVAEAR